MRLLRLVPLLLRGNWTREALIHALAADLAADGLEDALPALHRGEDPTSTINRDLRLVRDLGLVEQEPGHGYHCTPGPGLPLWVTPTEAHALEAARHALGQLGMPEATLLDGLLDRVPARIRREKPQWSLAPSLKGIKPEVWEGLVDALARGRCLRIEYKYPDREVPEVRVLDRAKLAWMTGAFYLCAIRPDLVAGSVPTFEHVREYRVDRILAVVPLEQAVACTRVPTLKVVFRLSAELQGRVHAMHDGDGLPVQLVATLADGTLRVTVQEISLLRARQRILAFGEHVVSVETPTELRLAVKREVERLNAHLTP